MSEQKLMNRWLAVIGAVLLQLALGAIYSWSVFAKELQANGWLKSETQIPFSVSLVTFAIVMVWAGRNVQKIGTRKLAMTGGVVLGIGYILTGALGAYNIWITTIFFGVIGGAGIGLGYVIPVGVGMKWFPDKKGLITGLAMAGFGFGGAIWIGLAGTWANLMTSLTINGVFILYGIIFAAMVILGGFFMVNPPDGYKPEGWTPPEVKEGSKASKTESLVNFEPKEILKTKQFLILFVTFIFSAGAGLMTIGLAKTYPEEALIANGYSLAQASSIATMAIAVFYGIFNGTGRIVWGFISDKIGWKKSILFMAIIQGIMMILFQWLCGFEATLYLGISLIAFNFGANFTLFPAATAGNFGTDKISEKYGYMFLAYGIGGVVMPLLGGAMGDADLFAFAFTLSGILTLICAFFVFMLKPAKKA
ncbi:MAG: OFA family MFS transporter [Candidatus Hodarchaeota archaeon]